MKYGHDQNRHIIPAVLIFRQAVTIVSIIIIMAILLLAAAAPAWRGIICTVSVIAFILVLCAVNRAKSERD